MIKVEMELRQAAAVREALFETTKAFTYDEKCTPERVTKIRQVIVELDNQIEAELESEKSE
jgi:hypothetical protein